MEYLLSALKYAAVLESGIICAFLTAMLKCFPINLFYHNLKQVVLF